jgi:hypothetical protein
MIRTDVLAVANHLWQLTLCAGVVWVLSFALKRNRAATRHRLWLAASMKFLAPFSLFASIGSHLEGLTVPAARQLQWSLVMDEISRPFVVSVPTIHGIAQSAKGPVPALLFSICSAALR